MLAPRSLPRTLRGVGGVRLIDMPGVKYPDSMLKIRKGADARSGKPHAKPPDWGISTQEASKKLGITLRATRALLNRHKSQHQLVAQPGRCPCMYWERRLVDGILAKRMPMVIRVPDKLCNAHEACFILLIGRSSLTRYVKRGLLKEYRLRHVTKTGVRLLSFFLRADVRKLAACRNAARARAENFRRERLQKQWKQEND